MERYFGTYHRFETTSKNEASLLNGADNTVGDEYEVVFEDEIAWLKNRFGSQICHFDTEFSRKLRIFQARGWKITAFLALVAYTDKPDPGIYWGEMVVISYDPSQENAFQIFAKSVAEKLAEGIRPDVALNDHAVDLLLSSNGAWLPDKRTPLPEREGGTVFLKTRRLMSEKLIEQGRQGNKGCYAISILFLIALAALAIFLVLKCFT